MPGVCNGGGDDGHLVELNKPLKTVLRLNEALKILMLEAAFLLNEKDKVYRDVFRS